MSQFGSYGFGGQFGATTRSGVGVLSSASNVASKLITLANQNVKEIISTKKYGIIEIMIAPYPDGQLGPYFRGTAMKYMALQADGSPDTEVFNLQNTMSSTNASGTNAALVIEWEANGLKVRRQGEFPATQFMVKIIECP